MDINEILAIEDIETKIGYLKKGRKYPLPDIGSLMDDWNPKRHEIMVDTEKYPKIKITTKQEQEVYDERTGKRIVIPAETKEVEPNRITLPLEQDIVNIQTAFTVGTEPSLDCSPSDEELPLLETVRQVLKKNKINYQNRRIVRSWLSETECAEYWYAVSDDGFWDRISSRINRAVGNKKPEYRLKTAFWSPFRGDKLYPFFDEKGDMVAFSREYKKRGLDGKDTLCFMAITADRVYNWDSEGGWHDAGSFSHEFGKIPVIYCHRRDAYCDKIHTIRVRLEKLLSEYADCIDYHFFPILELFGEVENFAGDVRNRVVQLTGEGANAAYLTWNQSSDPVRVEFENHLNQAYALTNTPRISFDQLKGSGNALSGVSFRYVFMGAHMAVENHAEVIGEFMQRRINLLVSALGSINPSLSKASRTIDIDVSIQPYMIDSLSDKVSTAVQAVDGGIWSRREGILFAGNADRIDEEIKEIKEDMAAGNGGNPSINN